MEKKLRLDLERLAVESHDTTPSAPEPDDAEAIPTISRVTSCPNFPYCTC